MASYGIIWPSDFENHIKVFPHGQLCVELDKERIVSSASSLIISLKPSYRKYTWHELTAATMFDNHEPTGDSLYGVMTSKQYVQKVINVELTDPVLSSQLKNGFRFIKVLSGYLYSIT